MTLSELCDNVCIQGKVFLSVWKDLEEEYRVCIEEADHLDTWRTYESSWGIVNTSDYEDMVVSYIYPADGGIVIELERIE